MWVGCMDAPAARAACIGRPSFVCRQASRDFPVGHCKGWGSWKSGWAGKLCPWSQERQGFRLKPSDGKWNPLRWLEICRAVNVACGNPTRPMNGQVWQRFFGLFTFLHWSTEVSALEDTQLYGFLPPIRTGLQEMQPPSKPSELPHWFRLFRLLWKETQTFLPGGDSNSGPLRRNPRS